MDEIKFRAMRAAGIGCFVMLAIIGFFVFTTPTNELIDFLTEVGQMAWRTNHDWRFHTCLVTAVHRFYLLLFLEMGA